MVTSKLISKRYEITNNSRRIYVEVGAGGKITLSPGSCRPNNSMTSGTEFIFIDSNADKVKDIGEMIVYAAQLSKGIGNEKE